MDKYKKFYRSLPSAGWIDGGRLVLMGQLKWYRIGILYSSELKYLEVR